MSVIAWIDQDIRTWDQEILGGITERELEVAAAALATTKHNLLKYLAPPTPEVNRS
jgi:hypothetical protein